MNEYSRILIEEYCESHNSRKSKRLERLIEFSYSMEMFPSDADAIFLEKTISNEKNSELNEAMDLMMSALLLQL